MKCLSSVFLPLPEAPGVVYSADRTQTDTADAVIFHVPSLASLPLWKPEGQIWIAWSLESSVNYPRLRDPGFMSRMDLTMTYRQDADSWQPYFMWYPADSFLTTLARPPRPKASGQLIASFVSSSCDESARLAYLAELAGSLDLHSYGRRGENRTLAEDRGRESKLEAIAGYKLTVAFENSIDEDYVTEKLFDPLVAGSVPVYLGAPNIDELAPGDHCFINALDFGSPRELAEHLRYLDSDEDAYQAYFAWKNRPLRPAFQARFERYRRESSWTYVSELVLARIRRAR